MCLRTWLPFLLCATSWIGCSSTAPAADGASAAVADASPDASPTPSPDREQTACTGPDVIPLVKSEWAGEPIALYVPTTVEGGTDGFLHLDSASAYTLLFAPEADGWIQDYRRAKIGCADESLPGFGGLGTMPAVEGKPVVGMMGADWLLAEPSLLDITGAKLVRRPADLSPVADGVDLPHEIVQGELLIEATFDGKPVAVILDTGAGHTVYVDATPRPNETEIVTEDALGRPLTMYQSSIVLGLGGRTKTVTLLRAPKFDIVERLSQQMGRKVDGLVGLSALRALHVDEARGVLRAAL